MISMLKATFMFDNGTVSAFQQALNVTYFHRNECKRQMKEEKTRKSTHGEKYKFVQTGVMEGKN